MELKKVAKVGNVTVLTRAVSFPAEILASIWTHAYYQDSSSLGEFKASGARIAVVDYSSAESSKSAITGVDVVISALRHDPSAFRAVPARGTGKGCGCEAIRALRVW